METMILTSAKDLKNLMKEAITEVKSEEQKRLSGQKLFTINEVAKRLGKAHGTIKKLCKAGVIETTKSGLITEQAIENYLSRK